MQTIITPPLVTVFPRPLNERLWELHQREAAGIATSQERAELDAMCKALEDAE